MSVNPKRQKRKQRTAAKSVKHPMQEMIEKRMKKKSSPELIHDFRKNKSIRKKKK